jgi:hypothetical protein
MAKTNILLIGLTLKNSSAIIQNVDHSAFENQSFKSSIECP